MALKTIKLGLAERQIAQHVLSDLPKVDIGTARMVRAVRERLELRAASKRIDKLEQEATEDGLPRPDWEDLLEVEAETYTADELYLRWLQERMQEKDWSKVRQQMPDGLKQVEVRVSTAQMVAIANLADALADALGASGKEKGASSA